jgi:hypothetical protein
MPQHSVTIISSPTDSFLKIAIAGLISKEKKPIYVGMYTSEDLDARRRQLEEIITNCQGQCSRCEYDPPTGSVKCCLDTCVSHNYEGEQCLVRKFYAVHRDVLRLDKRPLFTQFFSDPLLADLNGFLNREGLLNSHM